MSDVFISYKRDDEARVSVLVNALDSADLDVWWDKKIAAAERWRDRIQTELESAKCVIVVWSHASTGPGADFVIDEANRAKSRGILLQVRIDDIPLPLGFGEHQAVDLVHWPGNASDPRFQYLLGAAKARIAGLTAQPPAARKYKKAIWSSSFALILLAVLLARLPVCDMPGVRSVCGSLGVAGVPSRAEETFWRSRRSGDCTLLRVYLAKFPHGAYSSEARESLASPDTHEVESWTNEEKRLPLAVRSSLQPHATKAAAQADALARAQKDAADLCRPYNQGEFRLRESRAASPDWRCLQHTAGFACAFDGEAICQVSVKQINRIQTCP